MCHLSRNLKTVGFELAMPAARISNYYSLPIASCIFSPRRIVVTVKVTIKRREDSWKLFEYFATPLAWRNYTCSMSDKYLFVAVSKQGAVRTIVGYKRAAFSGLCLLPRRVKGASISKECVSRFLRGATVDELRTNCPFFCQTFGGEGPSRAVHGNNVVVTLL